MRKKILVFKIAAIGDVLMTTPFIRQLRRANPDAQIDYLVGKHSSAIIKDNPHIDKMHVFDDAIFFKKQVFKWRKLVNKMRKEKYDVAYVLDKHWSFALSAMVMNISVRYGFNRMDKEGRFLTASTSFGGIRHDIHYYLDLLKLAGHTPDYDDEQMELTVPKAEREFADNYWKEHKLGSDVIGFLPGGGNNPGQKLDAKIYPVERFVDVIKKLDHPVVLVGGPGDLEKQEHIQKECPNVLSVIGQTSIAGSAAILEKCAAVVCSDSGPLHIAASVNPNIIAIFGPTHPKRKGPLSKSACVIWEDEAVYDADAETYGHFAEYTFFQGVSTTHILSCIEGYTKTFKSGDGRHKHGDYSTSQKDSN